MVDEDITKDNDAEDERLKTILVITSVFVFRQYSTFQQHLNYYELPTNTFQHPTTI
jgi:hypothetical protein